MGDTYIDTVNVHIAAPGKGIEVDATIQPIEDVSHLTSLSLDDIRQGDGPITLDLEILWERVGEIRTKQIEDLNADAQTRDHRQGWVAGILQAIQILTTGDIADVTEETWEECRRRFPFPSQSSELGSLRDYRDVKVTKTERQGVPEENTTQTFPRELSSVEVAADPTLAGFVVVEDATGEEPDAVVSPEVFDHIAAQSSDG